MEIMTHPFFKSIEWEAVSISGFMTISGLMNISGLIKNFLTLEIHGMSGIWIQRKRDDYFRVTFDQFGSKRYFLRQ